jgi:hypothetical protein
VVERRKDGNSGRQRGRKARIIANYGLCVRGHAIVAALLSELRSLRPMFFGTPMEWQHDIHDNSGMHPTHSSNQCRCIDGLQGQPTLCRGAAEVINLNDSLLSTRRESCTGVSMQLRSSR